MLSAVGLHGFDWDNLQFRLTGVTGVAALCEIRFSSCLLCNKSRCFELLWYNCPGGKMHFVRRLPSFERRVRYVAIVLLDIKRDKLSHRLDRIEVVQVQPLMLEHSPPRFDHAVGEHHVDLRQYPLECA